MCDAAALFCHNITLNDHTFNFCPFIFCKGIWVCWCPNKVGWLRPQHGHECECECYESQRCIMLCSTTCCCHNPYHCLLFLFLFSLFVTLCFPLNGNGSNSTSSPPFLQHWEPNINSEPAWLISQDDLLAYDVVGTWLYMAPEVIGGSHIPAPCDMWSIGELVSAISLAHWCNVPLPITRWLCLLLLVFFSP